MAAFSAEQNVLAAVVAFRDGAIDARQLEFVCRLWASRHVDVMEILRERCWIDAAKQRALEAELHRRLALAGGARTALRQLLDEQSRGVLGRVVHPSVRDVLAALDRVDSAAPADVKPVNGVLAGCAPVPRPRAASGPRRRRRWSILKWPAGILALALLAAAGLWLVRERRDRLATESALALSMDVHAAQVQRLLEGGAPLSAQHSALLRDLLRAERAFFEQVADASDPGPAADEMRGRAQITVVRIDLALGAPPDAIGRAKIAIAALNRVHSAAPDDFVHRADVANAYTTLGCAYVRANQTGDAVKAFRAAWPHYEVLVRAYPERTDERRRFAEMLLFMGNTCCRRGEWIVAGGAYDRARPLWQQLADDNPADLDIQAKFVSLLHGLYVAWHHNGAAIAERSLQRCTPLARTLASEHPAVPDCQYVWASVLLSLSDRELASCEQQLPQQVTSAAAVVSVATIPRLSAVIAATTLTRHLEPLRQSETATQDYLRQGRALAEQLRRDQPNTPAYDNLAAELQVVAARYEAELGDSLQAVQLVEKALQKDRQPTLLFHAALAYTHCAMRGDTRVPAFVDQLVCEQYAKRAVELFRQANSGGFFPNDLLRMREFRWLRQRADFRAVYRLVEP